MTTDNQVSARAVGDALPVAPGKIIAIHLSYSLVLPETVELGGAQQ